MNRKHLSLLASLGFAAFLSLAQTDAALATTGVAPNLGQAWNYALLATNSSATVGELTCTTSTINNGNLGTTFTSHTDTGPCTLQGTAAFVDNIPAQVKTDFNNAFAALNTLNPTCDGPVPTTTQSVTPGVYCSAAGTTIGAGVTLTLSGNATDVWVFKIGTSGSGALTGNSFHVVMGGTALACNVYWRTAEEATMTDSDFIGTILAGTAVTLTGGTYLGRAMATTNVTLTDVQPMALAACTAPASITVNKNFVPDNPAAVSVGLVCTSGLVSATPLNASEGSPAVFTVTGASPGATCSATEGLAPGGYTKDETNCALVPLNGSCTIVNTLNGLTTFTVKKDFIPNSPAAVSVGLLCTSGLVSPLTPLSASEGFPAVFTVTGAGAGATCTAAENPVPTGYGESDNCANVLLNLNGNTNCTITNTLNSNAIVVIKDFIPDNATTTVQVTLACDSGAPTTPTLPASEGSPAVFTVTGGTGPCTATEIVPVGYAADQTNCVGVPLGSTCTITNAFIPPRPSIPALSGRAVIMLTALLVLLGLAAIRRMVT